MQVWLIIPYGVALLNPLYTVTMVINMAKHYIEIPLCEARHEITTNEGKKLEGGIFPKVVEDPMNFEDLEETVYEFLWAFRKACDYVHGDTIVIDLYVTGLTPCLVAFLNMVNKYTYFDMNIKATLYHYNRETESYEAQKFHTLWGAIKDD